MRTPIGIAAVLLGVMAVIGLPLEGTPQATPRRDPRVIDARGYQQIVQQRRGKPLLITFWATWCEPCRDEYPMLNELAKQYGPKGLQVIGVDFDDEGDLILMRRFIARYKPVFPNYRKQHGGEAAFTQAVWPEWNGALPASFLYDKDGKQVGRVLGASTRDTYESAIRQLLAGGTDSASR